MSKVIGDYTAAATIDGSTNYLLIQPGSSSTAYNKINRNVLLGVSGQPADLTTVQTVQNKVLDNSNTITVKDTLLTLQDNADTTKQAKFELSGITSATTRTYTLPDATTTIVGTGTTQTLTNKTITSPTITGGTYDNGTITVDAIGGHTSANVVTVAGLQINNGALNTNNSVVTANITDAAVTPAKLIAGTGTGWSWASWTPIWTNFTAGNATITAAYVQTGKTVTARLRVILGNTSSMGTAPNFTLPVTSLITSTSGVFGYGSVTVGGTTYEASILRNSGTVGQLIVWNAGGTYLSTAGVAAAVPGAWTTNDSFDLWLIYEAA